MQILSRVFLVLCVILCSTNCGTKQIAKVSVVKAIKPVEYKLSEEELLKKYVNNEFENYKDAHSSTYSPLPPAMEIIPQSPDENIVFKFDRLETESKVSSLFRVEVFVDELIHANYYYKLIMEDGEWKIDRIYMFDIQEVLREIYYNSFNKSKLELHKDFKVKRQQTMTRVNITDTLVHNKKYGDFEAYKAKASKTKLISQTDDELINYFKMNKSKFEDAITKLKGENYLEDSDPENGKILKELNCEVYDFENKAHYFSFITGFGLGLEGQDIGFVKSTSNSKILQKRFHTNWKPYLLLIPIEGDWFLYKQK